MGSNEKRDEEGKKNGSVNENGIVLFKFTKIDKF